MPKALVIVESPAKAKTIIQKRFAEFVLDYGLATIAWENGVDFAPDYLYERLNAVH